MFPAIWIKALCMFVDLVSISHKLNSPMQMASNVKIQFPRNCLPTGVLSKGIQLWIHCNLGRQLHSKSVIEELRE